MYKMNKNASYTNIYYYCYNNIILNVYLIGYIFYPDKFKNKIINIKKTIDNCYNMMLMISFRDDILNKYEIDIFDIYKQFTNIMTPTTYKLIETDNISVMSSVSSLSSLNDDSESNVSSLFDFDDDI